MEVGVVRVAEDSDFRLVKRKCLGLDDSFDTSEKTESDGSKNGNEKNSAAGTGWRMEHETPDTTVWIKFDKAVSDTYCVRVKCEFEKVSLTTLFDVLLDPNYRKTWDTMVIDTYDLCRLTPNTTIGYYSVRCPPPITNRDFVLLTSFLDLRTEIYVVSYSVNHKKLPPKKGLVRGISYTTAFYGVANDKGGCTLYYISQSDPKGKLPSWFVNKASKFFAPRFLKKLEKCCLKYPEWKKKNKPDYKPWLFPEQMADVPRLDFDDILPIDSLVTAPSVNEEAAQEDVKATQEYDVDD